MTWGTLWLKRQQKAKLMNVFFLNHIIIYLFKFTEVKDHN